MTHTHTFRSERGPILIALMTTNALVAINATLLAAAIPAVVADLGGLTLFPWLFSLYMLAQAASIPVYAKLADLYGRKPLILFGMAVFAVASVLCGFAWDMPSLIVLRTLQGLGAGAVHPIAVTIMSDLYTVRERAKVQGYLAGAWGLGSISGPLLGGVLAVAGEWRASFFLTIPLVAAAAWLIIVKFKEPVVKAQLRLDYLGAATLTIGLTLLVLGVLSGGINWAWGSPQSVGCFVGGLTLLLAFVFIETRVFDPIVPLGLLKQRLLAAAAFISIGAGAIIAGLATYIPLYMVGTLGLSPLLAGLTLCAFMAGWPIATSASTRIYLVVGYRVTTVVGGSIMMAGTAILIAYALAPTVLAVLVACFAIGIGLGLAASPALISAQASVEWKFRGVVSGTIMFCRLLGSALGIAIFGALGNGVLHASGETPSPEDFANVGLVVFIGVGVSALVCLVAAIAMPPHRPPPKTVPAVVDDSSIA